MNIKIGDKVKFVNENLDGVVTSILDNLTLGVTVNNDFEIPVLSSQVVKISFDDIIKPSADPLPKEVKGAENGEDENMYVAFVQKTEQEMELYFINHSKHTLFVNYYTKKEERIGSKVFQSIDPYDYRCIDILFMTDFTEWPEFHFQLLIKPEQQELQPVVRNLIVLPTKFFKHLRAIPLLQKTGYLFQINEGLNETDINKLLQFNPSVESNKNTDIAFKPPSKIIDLHIDKIHANYTQLTKQETLQFQLNYFEKKLEDAIATGMRKITFIHGVGNLKLKNEILRILKLNTGVIHVAEASLTEFGYGATDIFFSES